MCKDKSKDMINSPSHYTFGKFEVMDVIEDWNLGFHLGNAVKYIARSKHKGNEKEDLRKAIWYLTRKLNLKDPSICFKCMHRKPKKEGSGLCKEGFLILESDGTFVCRTECEEFKELE